MEATRLIIEYLVAGTLTLISLFGLVISIFSNKVSVLTTVSSPQSTLIQAILDNEVILSTVFIALSYGIGIAIEYAGEQLFEKRLDRIKVERLLQFISNNKPILMKSAILKPLIETEETKAEILTNCVGQLRFFVMKNSPSLYADIATQISRLRLIRVLFLVNVLMGIAVLAQLFQGEFLFWVVIFGFIVTLGVISRMAVLSRFHRYCRAIERSYLILLYEQSQNENQQNDSSFLPE